MKARNLISMIITTGFLVGTNLVSASTDPKPTMPTDPTPSYPTPKKPTPTNPDTKPIKPDYPHPTRR